MGFKGLFFGARFKFVYTGSHVKPRNTFFCVLMPHTTTTFSFALFFINTWITYAGFTTMRYKSWKGPEVQISPIIMALNILQLYLEIDVGDSGSGKMTDLLLGLKPVLSQ